MKSPNDGYHPDQRYAAIADPGEHDDGRISLIDAATGALRDRGVLDGGGRKYIRPAVLGRRAFVTSCTGGPDRGMLPGSSQLEGLGPRPALKQRLVAHLTAVLPVVQAAIFERPGGLVNLHRTS